jgi:hypothetical protein
MSLDNSKSSAKGDGKNYQSVLEKIGGNVRGNRVIKVGGNDKTIRASYHLNPDVLAKKIDLWHSSGKFPSPYSKSIATDLIDSLVSLGVNELHPLSNLKREMKRLMSAPGRFREGLSDWDRFKNKSPRSDKGKDVNGRIIGRIEEMQQTSRANTFHPKGHKLEQMGVCLDLVRVSLNGKTLIHRHCAVYVRLNTHSSIPLRHTCKSLDEVPEVVLTDPTKGPKL